jgi:hydrogenase maturation protease
MSRRVPVFVCGEPTRGDDAAGFAAVDLLPGDVRARADIVTAGQLDILLLLDLPADAPCVVVDAVAGLPPGQVWVRPLAALIGLDPVRVAGRDARPRAGRGGPEPRSSHELPLQQVLALAATLRASPPVGTFVGIGGLRWDVGAPLSPEVVAGLPTLAEAVAAAIDEAARSGDEGA